MSRDTAAESRRWAESALENADQRERLELMVKDADAREPQRDDFHSWLAPANPQPEDWVGSRKPGYNSR